MVLRWELTTSDTSPPIVSREEAKYYIGLSPDIFEHDALVDMLVAEASEFVQRETNQRAYTESWVYSLWKFPHQLQVAQTPPVPIQLPLSPVQGVTEFRYLDHEGNDVNYTTFVLAGDEPQYVLPEAGLEWPQQVADPYPSNVRLTLTVGTSTPAQWAKLACLGLVSSWFDIRGAIQDVELRPVPFGVKHLLRQNKLPDMFTEYDL